MEKKKQPKKNNRRRYSNKGNKKKPEQGTSPQNQRPASKNNKKRKKTFLKAHEIVQKYDNLLNQYITVRKKYFDQYRKLGFKKKEALMRNYLRTLEDLNRFATKLKPWQREILEKDRTEAFPLDTQYSSSKELPLTGEIEEGAENFFQVHMNETQSGRSSYKQDTEASSGSMDDYNSYKESVSS